MKEKNEYFKKLLDAFEISEKQAIDLRDLQKSGLNYERDENFAFHMQLMNDRGFVEREDKGPGIGYDKAVDGSIMWSILPLRLTASGHEFHKKLNEKNKDDLLEVMYRKGCSLDKAVLLGEVKFRFDHWDDDTFLKTAQALVDDNLIILRRAGFAIFTLDGTRRAESRLNPSPHSTQNTMNVGTITNSPIQIGGAHANMIQTISYKREEINDLHQLIDLFEKHFDELSLDAAAKRKATAQITTIKAQIEDEPDPIIIQQAGQTLRNVTEGAIGSLIAAAAQPGIWALAKSIMTKYFC